MSVYVVTWNLNKERDNYATARAELIKRLESYEHTRDSGLESVWFISTTTAPSQIDALLRQKFDSNDRLFVSKLNRGDHQGWLSKTVWDWINARL